MIRKSTKWFTPITYKQYYVLRLIRPKCGGMRAACVRSTAQMFSETTIFFVSHNTTFLSHRVGYNVTQSFQTSRRAFKPHRTLWRRTKMSPDDASFQRERSGGQSLCTEAKQYR